MEGGSGTESGHSVQRRPEETTVGGSQQLLGGGGEGVDSSHQISWAISGRTHPKSIRGPSSPSPIPNPKDAGQAEPLWKQGRQFMKTHF